MNDNFDDLWDKNKTSTEELAKFLQEQNTDNVTHLNDYMPDDTPVWCNDWVFVNSHNAYMHLPTMTLHSAASFNVENTCLLPAKIRTGAVTWTSRFGYIDKVHQVAYLPRSFDRIADIDGIKVINSFTVSSLPKAADTISDEGNKVIDCITAQADMLCGADSETLLYWIAHQVQYPGSKLLWAPIIQGAQGIGKSFFGELLRSCLGDTNVGTVSTAQVTSEFNSWATGKLVNVLEELKISNRSGYQSVNAIKPLITDRMIQINEKGVKQFDTWNHTNYICFTNYKDAIPLDTDDRRWWVVYSKVQSVEEIEYLVGMPANEWFTPAFEGVRKYRNEVKRWLLDMVIPKSFIDSKVAPKTESRQAMIMLEEQSTPGLIEAKAIIKAGGHLITNDVVSSKELFARLISDYEIEFNNTRDKSKLLKKLGYMPALKQYRIDGEPRRVFIKHLMNDNDIKYKLEESICV